MTDGARPLAEEGDLFWIFDDEIKAINVRRAKLGCTALELPAKGNVLEAIGLALSGGGVRSAAVSLGVLQAINYCKVLPKIDYVSTVSGGGYTGCSVTASMSNSAGQFVYGAAIAVAAAGPRAKDISDTAAVGHIRNYSNYLIPAGLRDLVTAIAIVVRGLVTNLGVVSPIVLLLAALTIWSTPTRSDLTVANLFGLSLRKYLPVAHFGLSLALFLAGLVLFFLWALYRSLLAPTRLSEFRSQLPSLGAAFLVLLAVAFFCELQPLVIGGMFEIYDQTGQPNDVALAGLTGWIKTLAATFAPIGAVVMFFRQQLGDVFKSTTDGITSVLVRGAIKGAVWVAGLALPLCIWVAFLYLCFWGIQNDTIGAVASNPCRPGSIAATITIDSQSFSYQGDVQGGLQTCAPSGTARPGQPLDAWSHAPVWLKVAATGLSSKVSNRVDGAVNDAVRRILDSPMVLLYLFAGVVLFIVSWILTPNANSLHRLYRDRLSKAFLFDPTENLDVKPKAGQPSLDQGRDFAQLDTMWLGDLSDEHAPYHLINAALNIQGSDYANRRGRNADFFLFSKYWIGSVATGYAPTEVFEPASPDLTLATAMAISGAAASSNMGSGTVRPLTPTLAILNVRLGYWLKNPAFWAPTGAPMSYKDQLSARNSWIPRHRLKLYLWSEISGRLYENSDQVYLTDGGHIENLGIYELLRRKCRVIVAVDAEADSSMHFPSLITLQRYARIDLGIRIDLPWRPIQSTTLAWMNPPKDRPAPQPSKGPHVAIGTIDYGGGETGYLVYFKSSLTGDENDYIRDYARRYPRFPHESTGDQFFSEEQFEVYRALGFHMVSNLLSNDDDVEVPGATGAVVVKFSDTTNPVVSTVRQLLTG